MRKEDSCRVVSVEQLNYISWWAGWGKATGSPSGMTVDGEEVQVEEDGNQTAGTPKCSGLDL
jgi:hypothetical protein